MNCILRSSIRSSLIKIAQLRMLIDATLCIWATLIPRSLEGGKHSFRTVHMAFTGSRRREELRKEKHGNQGRWVFAETVHLSQAQALLPAHHPSLSDPYARGLPQDCLTYEQRYKQYRAPSDKM